MLCTRVGRKGSKEMYVNSSIHTIWFSTKGSIDHDIVPGHPCCGFILMENSRPYKRLYKSPLYPINTFRDFRNEYNGNPRNTTTIIKCTVNEVGTSDHNYSHLHFFHFFLHKGHFSRLMMKPSSWTKHKGRSVNYRQGLCITDFEVFIVISETPCVRIVFDISQISVWEVMSTIFVTHLVWPSRNSTPDLPTSLFYRSLASGHLLLWVPT